jgi:hypothetical protein
MMRTKAVAMVACVHDNRVITKIASFETLENRADALIYQGNKAEVPLFDAPVFVGRDSEK